MLIGLTDQQSIQENLFHPFQSSSKEAKLMKAVDSINHLWGSGTVQFASQGLQKKWQGKAEKRSKRYTTQWEELLVVA